MLNSLSLLFGSLSVLNASLYNLLLLNSLLFIIAILIISSFSFFSMSLNARAKNVPKISGNAIVQNIRDLFLRRTLS